MTKKKKVFGYAHVSEEDLKYIQDNYEKMKVLDLAWAMGIESTTLRSIIKEFRNAKEQNREPDIKLMYPKERLE
jgi:hypothetical protein